MVMESVPGHGYGCDDANVYARGSDSRWDSDRECACKLPFDRSGFNDRGGVGRVLSPRRVGV
jgi:hypothetical protein